MTSRRILCDLKPALDGYAGIPLETRLLFQGLQELEHEVHGLLQPDGGYGYSFKKPPALNALPRDKIYASAKAITSFYEKAQVNKGRLAAYRNHIRHWLHMQRLLWSILKNNPIQLDDFCGEHFQSFLWSRLFSKSLNYKDKESVCSAGYKFLGVPRSQMHYAGQNRFAGIFRPTYPTLNTSGYDCLIAQSPFPGDVARETKLIVRYHDAVPVFMPHTIENMDAHLAGHYADLVQNAKSGAVFVCVSEATRENLLKILPELEERAYVIHNMISEQYFPDQHPPGQVNEILLNRLASVEYLTAAEEVLRADVSGSICEPAQYLLMVSTLEPRKNHENLIKAWEMLRQRKYRDLKLVLVGNIGWNETALINLLTPWMERGEILHLSNVPTNELSTLYQFALATICPSLAEGFDYSGIEAMRCGGMVVASDIPVHREVYGDASIYFNPEDIEEMATKIDQSIDETLPDLRNEVFQASKHVAQKYCKSTLLPVWEQLLVDVLS